MSELQEYVKVELFGLTEDQWSDSDVLAFIEKSINLDSDVYDAIIDIDKADLYQHIAESDEDNVNREVIQIKKTMIVNAKEQIHVIFEDIR